MARYNFAARDMRELSLREGDVVKIYSRIGGDQGWWKGETNGRVSAFRSCSVLFLQRTVLPILNLPSQSGQGDISHSLLLFPSSGDSGLSSQQSHHSRAQ